MSRTDITCWVLALVVMFTLGATLAYGYTGGY